MGVNRRVKVAIAGATGAVGTEFVGLLERRGWQTSRLDLLASARSAGKKLPAFGDCLTVKDIETYDPTGLDIALFSAGSGPSKAHARRFTDAGCVVIDNSSAFRMDASVPLIVPEINYQNIQKTDLLIANPNCCAIILLMAIAPLCKLGTIRKIYLSTYQSASGAGAAAMEELISQSKQFLAGEPIQPHVFKHQIAFNLFSHNTTVGQDGYNDEEKKVIQEARKILGNPQLKVNPTCIRVPILRAHSESITVEFERNAPSLNDIRQAYREFNGVILVDDQVNNTFPMPLDASGIDDVLVGRLRNDLDDPSMISLFACGDQLLKGAALNTIQIAERIIDDRKLGQPN